MKLNLPREWYEREAEKEEPLDVTAGFRDLSALHDPGDRPKRLAEMSDASQAQIIAEGQALYEAKFKSLLEPTHNGEYIVIHVDTEDYALGDTFREAGRALQARHPKDGRMIGWKIGPEPDSD